MEDRHKSEHGELHERVARLEEGLVAVESAVVKIGRQLEGISTDLKHSHRPQWQVIFTGIAILISVTGGLWTVGIAPLQQKQEANITQTARNTDRVVSLERQEAAINEKLAEIETQFHGGYSVMNLMMQEKFQLINLTRRESGLTPVDMPTYWPNPRNR